MKFCTECGTKAEFDGQKFCKVCGHKFPEAAVAPEIPQDPTEVLLPKISDDETIRAPMRRPTRPAAPEQDATVYTPPQPAAPEQEAPVYTPVQPTAPEDEATIYNTPVQPVAPEDDAPTYTPVRPIVPEDDATIYTPVQPAAPEDDAPTYTPVQPIVPEDTTFSTPIRSDASEEDATIRAFAPPQGADDDRTVRADAFFEQPADAVPPVDEPPAELPRPRKKFPVVPVVIVVVLLLAALAVGGFFVWKKQQDDNSSVTIGEVSYSIEDTTNLSVRDPSDEDWNNLCMLTNLTSLSVTGNGSTELDETRLNKLLNLQKLEELSVENAVFPDGVAELADLDALEKLTLTGCQLTSEQCNGLDGPSALRELDLSQNLLTDISFLQSFPQLEKLDLSGNQITDYTPLSALTALTTLSVDQCQTQAVSALPALTTLTVDGKTVEDAAAYLADQKTMMDLYDSVIGWFNDQDFNTLKVVLQQMTDAGTLNEGTLSYVNGWLMNGNAIWDTIRASLPQTAAELVVDENGLYYGQLTDGKRSGQGVQMFAGNYSVYTGTWDNDLPNGAGTYRKTLTDGTVLELSGNYTNGYENGTMTFAATGSTGSQSGTYTAVNGTRTTIDQISDDQYAFIRFDTIYWYDASPDGHGVAINNIAYQEEKAVEILPEPVVEEPVEEEKSQTVSSSSKASSSGSSAPAASSTPSAAAETPAPAASSTPTQTDTGSGDDYTLTDEEILALILGGLKVAKDIYDMY